jgi:hypothetical protein
LLSKFNPGRGGRTILQKLDIDTTEPPSSTLIVRIGMAISLEVDSADEGQAKEVDQTSASWNRMSEWLNRLDACRQAA